MTTPHAQPQKSAVILALRFYRDEIIRNRWAAVPALLLPALGTIGLSYIAPLVIAGLAGRFVAAGGQLPPDAALWGAATLAGIILASEALWRGGFHGLNRLAARGVEHLYAVGMDELLAKDASFFHNNFAGSLTKRVLSFASRFEPFVDALVFHVMTQFVPLIFASVVLWQYDPLLVVVLVGLIAVTGLVVTPLVRRRQRLVDQREAASARVSGHVADTLSNMDTVRAFAAERREAQEHGARIADYRRKMIRSWDYANLRIDTLVSAISAVMNATGLLIAVGLAGRVGVEAILVTFMYFWNASGILFRFNQIYRQLESCVTEAAQFTQLLEIPPTVLDRPAPEPVRRAVADVRFEAVHFTHAGGLPLFTGLDLVVPGGTRAGLVGRSGGGKTTLSRLLLRMMDVDAGRITIGGQDIAGLRQSDLRSLIAYVPQDPTMFHRTLRDNIAFGRPGATEQEILAAAEAAHVTEFVDGLPEGFDTLVGERGVKLSGGQRQRVALARAILRDAPILLLDEATSALDSASEVLIQDALWRLMEGRTALVVAHRLSTVAQMDQLVVLERGQVVEQGSHAELLARGGVYAGLWEHQSGGFLEPETATDADRVATG
ncbi:ABC transporter ATP-binding protein [Actinomycetes bacterium KLBMP 9759]